MATEVACDTVRYYKAKLLGNRLPDDYLQSK